MRDDGWKIAREAYSSEVVSIIINIFVGLLLTLLILPRASFNQIVIMVPALLSARGNISGSYSARVARDLIIGQFKKNLRDNMISTVFLSTITGFVIGGIALVIAITIVPSPLLPVHVFFLLPILSMSLTMV
ncbi:MAG: hypothetical protein GYA24_22465, partial [Candidatus Lokiarchaeota archaeon]|nr:hypothetical protein [Candidatus Lokiarchaeota archaeon]